MTTLVSPNSKNLGSFSVNRFLPNSDIAQVGPFVFFDHLGPVEFAPGEGIDVRPHPHIGLATLSYLFEGSILHRDSLGFVQEIQAGDVNWMTAGKGIVHSERQSLDVKGQTQRLNLLQLWIALPKEKAEIEPSFQHVPRSELPNIHRDKIHMRLIAGEAYGYTSPVRIHSPLHYIDVMLQEGAELARPNPSFECAIYVQLGEIEINDSTFANGSFIVLGEQDQIIASNTTSRFVILGGPKAADKPILFWNFVAYSPERLHAAKEQWRKGEFPTIPNDNEEFIPLPT